MNKTIYFVSGLPRSGSTLLCNILAQNPRFQVTATSGILEVLLGVRAQWDQLAEFKAHPEEDAKLRVLRGILDAYHNGTEKPVVFDKSRAWLAHLEMAETILEQKVKVLVPVRDVRDILASFETIWRNAARSFQLEQERENYVQWQTLGGRCKIWAREDQPLGIAYNRIQDAVRRGFSDRMLFIEYEKLTAHPAIALAKIHEFLMEEMFIYDFKNVQQVTVEDDLAYGFPPGSLHTIRPEVKPQEPRWPTVLGDDIADVYKTSNFWEGIDS